MNFSLLTELNPILQVLIATIFTWFLTTIGAASVFLTKEVNRKVLDGMLGFAAGVMLAAISFPSFYLHLTYLYYRIIPLHGYQLP
jgi:zinc transporter ZupT